MKKKLINYMLDVAFTIETPISNWYDIPAIDLVDALQRRVDYLRENLDEAGDAFGLCDSYEIETEETTK